MNLSEALSLIQDVEDFPKKGVGFKDITPVFENAEAFEVLISSLAESVARLRPHKIVAIESRGFLLGSPLALKLQCGMVLVRKKGKLPRETLRQSYQLEYGVDEIEIHADAISKGERVVIVDDVLATGGTLEAAGTLCKKAGAEVVGLQVVLELGFLKGRERLNHFNLQSLKLI